MNKLYYKGSKCIRGHDGTRYKSSGGCVKCLSDLAKEDRTRNPKKYKKIAKIQHRKRYKDKKEKELQRQKEYRNTPKGRSIYMLKGSETRAKKLGVRHTITREWLIQKLEGRCEITGYEFKWDTDNKKNPYSPSLDRIDSTKGYVPENCRVIIWALNTAFSWWGEDEFKPIAETWLSAITFEKASGE